jgi:hypothetical protein
MVKIVIFSMPERLKYVIVIIGSFSMSARLEYIMVQSFSIAGIFPGQN